MDKFNLKEYISNNPLLNENESTKVWNAMEVLEAVHEFNNIFKLGKVHFDDRGPKVGSNATIRWETGVDIDTIDPDSEAADDALIAHKERTLYIQDNPILDDNLSAHDGVNGMIRFWVTPPEEFFEKVAQEKIDQENLNEHFQTKPDVGSLEDILRKNYKDFETFMNREEFEEHLQNYLMDYVNYGGDDFDNLDGLLRDFLKWVGYSDLEENKEFDLRKDLKNNPLLREEEEDIVKGVQKIVSSHPVDFINKKTVEGGDLIETEKYVLWVEDDFLQHIGKNHTKEDQPGSILSPNYRSPSGLRDLMKITMEKGTPKTVIEKNGIKKLKWLDVPGLGDVGKMGVYHTDEKDDIAKMDDHITKWENASTPQPDDWTDIKVKTTGGERDKTDIFNLITFHLGDVGNKKILSLATAFPGPNNVDGKEIPGDRRGLADEGFYFKVSSNKEEEEVTEEFNLRKYLKNNPLLKEDDDEWIQKGEKDDEIDKGGLHKSLGIPEDEKIPKSLINNKLAALKKKDEDGKKKGVQGLSAKDLKLYRQLNLAKSFAKMN